MVEPTSHTDATRLNASRSLGVFVGRQREMAGLRTVRDDAISGQGRLVMLTGEPGIGKTRVDQELAGAAESQGMRVFWGRCYEGLGAPPSGLGSAGHNRPPPCGMPIETSKSPSTPTVTRVSKASRTVRRFLLGRESIRSRICSLRAFKDATAAWPCSRVDMVSRCRSNSSVR